MKNYLSIENKCIAWQKKIDEQVKSLAQETKGKTYRICGFIKWCDGCYDYLRYEKRACKVDDVSWQQGYLCANIFVWNKVTKKFDIWIRHSNLLRDLDLRELTGVELLQYEPLKDKEGVWGVLFAIKNALISTKFKPLSEGVKNGN